jgi:hemolysin activation/secretion protein
LTLSYVDRGYVTSGAVLPEQTIEDGIVSFEIIEGSLSGVAIQNEGGRFRDSYLRKRIAPEERAPLNIYSLERRLQIIQQDRRIRRVEARLLPSSTRGLATLELVVSEAPPYRVGADFSNYRNPTIGSYGGEIRVGFDNAFGVGDEIFLRGTFTEGLLQGEGRFVVPLNAWDTTLTLRYQQSEADVVLDPIASALDIESRSRTIGAELRQPLYRSTQTRFETFLRGELRRSKSLLDGEGFSFTIDPDEDGVSKVSVLRWGLEWTHRSRFQALALRSIVSGGLNAFDATDSPDPYPDGQFVAWLAQLQWALRLPWLGAEILTRGDLQLANDRLLPLEQFAMGGRYTVRGYRENTLVRDNGVVGSVELRVPIYERVEPRLRVDLVPFVDAGHSWNSRSEEIGLQTLVSVGIGTRMTLTEWGFLEFYWGRALKEATRVGDHDPQDDGLHFRVSLDWP